MTRRPLLAAIAMAVFCMSLPPHAFSNEISDHTVAVFSVVNSFNGERFHDLEAESIHDRESKSRTESGIWRLSLFYAGINSVFDVNHKDLAYWLNMQDSIQRWLDEFPQSPAAHLAYATMLVNHGISFRGSGDTSSVAPQDWKPFYDYLEKARIYLEENKDITAQDPHWYELMALIAANQDWTEEKFLVLMAEAFKREPLFYQNYFAAVDYYAATGGGLNGIERFARHAMEETQGTEGFGMYARIYWYASQTHYGDRLFTQSWVDWATMKQAIHDVLEVYPDSWNINNFTRFACLSNDKELTAELMERIADRPLPEAWKNREYGQCKAWSAEGAGR